MTWSGFKEDLTDDKEILKVYVRNYSCYKSTKGRSPNHAIDVTDKENG